MKIYIYIFLLFILCLMILILLYIYDRIFYPEDVPDVDFPFINLKDENDKNLNILCIKAHLTENEKIQFLKYIKKGIKFIGCSSYLSFPRKCDNTYGYCHEDIKIEGKYIEEYVLGWCHCFREPDKYIKYNIPRILISESDFNTERLMPDNNIKIKYDYILVQPKDEDCKMEWHGHNKNWQLAEKAVKILSDDLNMKGLIVGRDDCSVNIKNKNNIETTGFLSYYDFIDKIRMSKFMLLPNLEDASPRVLTETLCLNKPILVNENILGGWKYVNYKTGEFFNQHNIKEQAIKLLNNYHNYTPREYFVNNYGTVNTGKRLKEFLQQIYPNLNKCKYVKFPI